MSRRFHRTGGWQRGLCGALAATLTLTTGSAPQAWATPAPSTPSVESRASSPDLSALDLTSLHVPEQLGWVVDTWQPPDQVPKALVLHIQDLHTHPKVQLLQSDLIGWLHDRLGVTLVAVEGAAGLCDTTIYSDFPDPSSTEKIARLFLNEGLFTGAEYYAITHPGTIRLWGVEEESLYLEHLKTHQQGAAQVADLAQTVAQLNTALMPLRRTLYPKTLHTFLTLREAYEHDAHDNAFRDYFQELQRLAKHAKLDLARYPHLAATAQAYELYDHLNLRQVEADQARLLERLWPRLPMTDQKRLTKLAQAIATQQTSRLQYYETLATLAHAHGILERPSEPQPHTALQAARLVSAMFLGTTPSQAEDDYPALQQYLTYLRLSKQFQAGALTHELEALEEQVEQAYLTMDQQRTLARLLKQVTLIEELLHVKLSPSHLRAYQQHKATLTVEALSKDLRLVTNHQLPVTDIQLEQLLAALPTQERFYDLALKRDEALVKNTLTQLEKHQVPAAMLIAGGFHTPGLTEHLKQHQVAYVVITPKTEGEFDESRYQASLQNAIPPIPELIHKLEQQALIAVDSTGETASKVPSQMTIPPEVAPDHQAHEVELTKRDAAYLSFLSTKLSTMLKQFRHKVVGLLEQDYFPKHADLVRRNRIRLVLAGTTLVLLAMGLELQFDLHEHAGQLLAMQVVGASTVAAAMAHVPDAGEAPGTRAGQTGEGTPSKILIPIPLRLFTDKQETVEVTATTVREALEELVRKYEGLRPHLYADDGHLRSFVNVYLNGEDITADLRRGKTIALASGDTLALVPSISGGTSGEGPEPAREYVDPAQVFRGVDLDHFIHAQRRLRLMTVEQLQPVLAHLQLPQTGTADEQRRRIFETLAQGRYDAAVVNLINGHTYKDPNLAIAVDYQSKNAPLQSVSEAVANSLDALGLHIGQFAEGVKQALAWVESGGRGRIDVVAKTEAGVPYQLTILADREGRFYIQLREVSLNTFHWAVGAAWTSGTAVRITPQTAIPRTVAQGLRQGRPSQEGIVAEVHRVFPFVSSARISTQLEGEPLQPVNGFGTKHVLVPTGEVAHPVEELAGRTIHVSVGPRHIVITDSGRGMDARTLARMFVPQLDDRSAEAAAPESAEPTVVHDATLPHRVSFARNGRVAVTVDLPAQLHEDATLPGGLLLELGTALHVSKSWDMAVIPANLAPGETSDFQQVVERFVRALVATAHAASSPAERVHAIRAINTIAAGLDGLRQGNPTNIQAVDVIQASMKEALAPALDELRRYGSVVLPHDRQFARLRLPDRMQPLWLHPALFDWRGAPTLEQIWPGDAQGAIAIPGLTVGGAKRIPLVAAPFRAEALERVTSVDLLRWHIWPEEERLTFIKDDRCLILPHELGGRLATLAVKRAAGQLRGHEEREFLALVQRVNDMTAEQVATSYETRTPQENIRLLEAPPPVPAVEAAVPEEPRGIDAPAIGKFLTDVPPEARPVPVSPPRRPATPRAQTGPAPIHDQPGVMPADANQRHVLLENGDVVEVGTGRVMRRGVQELVALKNGYYKLKTTQPGQPSPTPAGAYYELVKFSGTSTDSLIALEATLGDILMLPGGQFAYFQASVGTLDFLFDVENGMFYMIGAERHQQPKGETFTAIGPKPPAPPFNYFSDLQFSRDGRYLVYHIRNIEKGVVFRRERVLSSDLTAIDLQTKSVVKTVRLEGDIEYAINPFAPHLVYVRLKDTGVMKLLDVTAGGFIGIEATHLHTDSTGTYTAIVDERDEVSIYLHRAKRLLTKKDFGGHNLVVVRTLWHEGQQWFGMTTKVQWGYEEYHFNEDGVVGLGQADREYYEAFSIETKLYSITSYRWRGWPAEFTLIGLSELDPLQRLDQPGAYKHPYFELFIDHSDPAHPVAIDPKTSARYPYEGQIVHYDAAKGGLYTQPTPGVLSFHPLRTGIVGWEDAAIVDGIPANFWVLEHEGRWVLRELATGEFIPFFGGARALRTEEYRNASFDGKYFVFVNPRTGEVVYVDPQQPDQPILVSAQPAAPQPATPPAAPSMSVWLDAKPADAPNRFVFSKPDMLYDTQIAAGAVRATQGYAIERINPVTYLFMGAGGMEIKQWDGTEWVRVISTDNAGDKILTHTNKLVVIEWDLREGEPRQEVFDVTTGWSSPRQERIDVSPSGRFSVCQDANADLIYFDHGEQVPVARGMETIRRTWRGRSIFPKWRVDDKADVVILKDAKGTHALYSLPLGKMLFEHAEHIEIDSSGMVAVAKHGDWLYAVRLQDGVPITGPMLTPSGPSRAKVFRVASDDRFVYVQIGSENNMEIFDKEQGLKYGAHPDDLPRFWEVYDLEKKTIWDWEHNELASPSMVRYVDASPSDPNALTLGLFGTVLLNKRRRAIAGGRCDVYELSSGWRPDVRTDGGKDVAFLQGAQVWYLTHVHGFVFAIGIRQGERAHSFDLDPLSPQPLVTRSRTFLLTHGVHQGVTLIDSRGNVTGLADRIPAGFIPTDVNGEYFVFSNPHTGEVRYFNPAALEVSGAPLAPAPQAAPTPLPPPPPSAPPTSPEPTAAQRLWEEQIQPRRAGWIEQAQRAYQPLLTLIPAEFRSVIEAHLAGQIRELYESQEQAIRARFSAAVAAGQDTVDLSALPFDLFAQRMERVMAFLPGFLESLGQQMAREQAVFAVQQDTHERLFSVLFGLCADPHLSLTTVDEPLLASVAAGWDVTTPVQLEAVGVVHAFMQALRHATQGRITATQLNAIVGVLSHAASRDPIGQTLIIRQQAAAFISSPAGGRFLNELHQACADQTPQDLQAYVDHPDRPHRIGDAAPLLYYLTHDVPPVRVQARWLPEGTDHSLPVMEVAGQPLRGVAVSQVAALELQREKQGPDDVVMPITLLLDSLDHLPPPVPSEEAKVLLRVDVEAETGADKREMTQNAQDAGATELVVDFYQQHNDELDVEEYVEEARDDGTGALHEAALLFAQSTKTAGGQIDWGGFFGTAKFTFLKDVDRLEFITRNDELAFLFEFTVVRDRQGRPLAAPITRIRTVTDPRVARGLTVRRIKRVDRTIPALDQTLAQRAWKTFVGLAQDEQFRIVFVDHEGRRQPLVVRSPSGADAPEVLSQVPFRLPAPGQPALPWWRRILRAFVGKAPVPPTGILRLLSTTDMPAQVVDGRGYRVKEIPEDYFALVPQPLRRHVRELGLVIQIPLLLAINRNAFAHETQHLRTIQQHVAIAYYKALAYKVLTQTDPQFLFEGYPVDWEQAPAYFLTQDPVMASLARRINRGASAGISYEELEGLAMTADSADGMQRVAKLIVRLMVPTDPEHPERRESLLMRRQAVQRLVWSEIILSPFFILAGLVHLGGIVQGIRRAVQRLLRIRVPDLEQKLGTGYSMFIGQLQMVFPGLVTVEPETPEERTLVRVAASVARPFGIERIRLVKDTVLFAGAFHHRTFYLNRAVAHRLSQADSEQGMLDVGTNLLSHELAHLLEELRRLKRASLPKWIRYIADTKEDFTHTATGGIFDAALRYISAVSLARHDPAVFSPSPKPDSRGFSGLDNTIYTPAIQAKLSAGEFFAVTVQEGRFVPATVLHETTGQAIGRQASEEDLRLLNALAVDPADQHLAEGARLFFIEGLDQAVEAVVQARGERAPPEGCYGSHYGRTRHQYYLDLRHLPSPQTIVTHLHHEVQERAAVLAGEDAATVHARLKQEEALAAARQKVLRLIQTLSPLKPLLQDVLDYLSREHTRAPAAYGLEELLFHATPIENVPRLLMVGQVQSEAALVETGETFRSGAKLGDAADTEVNESSEVDDVVDPYVYFNVGEFDEYYTDKTEAPAGFILPTHSVFPEGVPQPHPAEIGKEASTRGPVSIERAVFIVDVDQREHLEYTLDALLTHEYPGRDRTWVEAHRNALLGRVFFIDRRTTLHETGQVLATTPEGRLLLAALFSEGNMPPSISEAEAIRAVIELDHPDAAPAVVELVIAKLMPKEGKVRETVDVTYDELAEDLVREATVTIENVIGRVSDEELVSAGFGRAEGMVDELLLLLLPFVEKRLTGAEASRALVEHGLRPTQAHRILSAIAARLGTRFDLSYDVPTATLLTEEISAPSQPPTKPKRDKSPRRVTLSQTAQRRLIAALRQFLRNPYNAASRERLDDRFDESVVMPLFREDGLEGGFEQWRSIIVQLLAQVSMPLEDALRSVVQEKRQGVVVRLPIGRQDLTRIVDSQRERALEVFQSGDQGYLMIIPGTGFDDTDDRSLSSATADNVPFVLMATASGHSHPRYMTANPSSRLDIAGAHEVDRHGFIICLIDRETVEVAVQRARETTYEIVRGEQAFSVLTELGILRPTEQTSQPITPPADKPKTESGSTQEGAKTGGAPEEGEETAPSDSAVSRQLHAFFEKTFPILVNTMLEEGRLPDVQTRRQWEHRLAPLDAELASTLAEWFEALDRREQPRAGKLWRQFSGRLRDRIGLVAAVRPHFTHDGALAVFGGCLGQVLLERRRQFRTRTSGHRVTVDVVRPIWQTDPSPGAEASPTHDYVWISEAEVLKSPARERETLGEELQHIFDGLYPLESVIDPEHGPVPVTTEAQRVYYKEFGAFLVNLSDPEVSTYDFLDRMLGLSVRHDMGRFREQAAVGAITENDLRVFAAYTVMYELTRQLRLEGQREFQEPISYDRRHHEALWDFLNQQGAPAVQALARRVYAAWFGADRARWMDVFEEIHDAPGISSARDLGAQFGGNLALMDALVARAWRFYEAEAAKLHIEVNRTLAPYQLVQFFIERIRAPDGVPGDVLELQADDPYVAELIQSLPTQPIHFQPSGPIRVILLDLPQDAFPKDQHVLDPEGGIDGLNFRDADGIWTIVMLRETFERQRVDQTHQTLKHELAEIARRQAGQDWQTAHNELVEAGFGDGLISRVSPNTQQRIEEVFEQAKAITPLPAPRKPEYEVIPLPGAEIHAIGVWQHRSEEALQILKDRVMPLVLEHPDEWFFIIEMATPEEQEITRALYGQEAIDGESFFAQAVANLLGIPVASPVLGIHNRQVIEAARQRGLGPQLVFIQLALDTRETFQKVNREFTDENAERLIRHAALRWVIEEDLLRQAYQEAVELEQTSPTRANILRRQIGFFLGELANHLTREALARVLDAHIAKRKVLILAGALHTGAVAAQAARHPLTQQPKPLTAQEMELGAIVKDHQLPMRPQSSRRLSSGRSPRAVPGDAPWYQEAFRWVASGRDQRWHARQVQTGVRRRSLTAIPREIAALQGKLARFRKQEERLRADPRTQPTPDHRLTPEMTKLRDLRDDIKQTETAIADLQGLLPKLKARIATSHRFNAERFRRQQDVLRDAQAYARRTHAEVWTLFYNSYGLRGLERRIDYVVLGQTGQEVLRFSHTRADDSWIDPRVELNEDLLKRIGNLQQEGRLVLLAYEADSEVLHHVPPNLVLAMLWEPNGQVRTVPVSVDLSDPRGPEATPLWNSVAQSVFSRFVVHNPFAPKGKSPRLLGPASETLTPGTAAPLPETDRSDKSVTDCSFCGFGQAFPPVNAQGQPTRFGEESVAKIEPAVEEAEQIVAEGATAQADAIRQGVARATRALEFDDGVPADVKPAEAQEMAARWARFWVGEGNKQPQRPVRVGIYAGVAQDVRALAVAPPADPAKSPTVNRPFGRTGFTFFPLGVGAIWSGRRWPPTNTAYVSPAQDEVDAYLTEAFARLGNDEGVVMVDTAAAYGLGEARFGEFFKQHPDLLARAFLATKWGEEFDVATEQSRSNAQTHSLANLQASLARSAAHLPKIDLLYIHQADLSVLRDRAVIEELQRLRRERVHGIQLVGVSISNPTEFQAAATAEDQPLAPFDVIQIPADFLLNPALARDLRPLIQQLARQGKAIVVNSPVRKGLANAGEVGAAFTQLLEEPSVAMILVGPRQRAHLLENIGYVAPDRAQAAPVAPQSPAQLDAEIAALESQLQQHGLGWLPKMAFHGELEGHAPIGDFWSFLLDPQHHEYWKPAHRQDHLATWFALRAGQVSLNDVFMDAPEFFERLEGTVIFTASYSRANWTEGTMPECYLVMDAPERQFELHDSHSKDATATVFATHPSRGTKHLRFLFLEHRTDASRVPAEAIRARVRLTPEEVARIREWVAADMRDLAARGVQGASWRRRSGRTTSIGGCTGRS